MRVVLYSASVGAGHMRAADAVVSALKRAHPDVTAEHVDVMKLVPPAFRKAYAESYLKLVDKLPGVWAWLYQKADRQRGDDSFSMLRKVVQKYNTAGILKHAEEWQPDVIVCTHFLPAELFSDLAGQKKRGAAKRPPLAVVITDHDVHSIWIYPRVDRYYTASDEISALLAKRGVDAGTIKTTGIPCDPIFGEKLDDGARVALRQSLGLADAPKPVLLLNAHGCGVSGAAAAQSLAAVANEVLASGPKTLLVICGRNERIKDALSGAIKAPAGCVVKVFGFVTNMHELLAVSDLCVTKPGGLSTSECLAREVPMVLVSPIPGQEERNAEMLLERGCAVLARSPEALAYKLNLLLNDPARLTIMKRSCKATGHPTAALDIAADCVQLSRKTGI